MDNKKYPRVVRQGTLYAVAVGERKDTVTLLGLFGVPVYDVRTMSVEAVQKAWDDAEVSDYVGRVRPTVEHFLRVLARSDIRVTTAALAAIDQLKEDLMPKHVYVSPKGDVTPEKTEGAVLLDATTTPEALKHLSERALAHFVSVALKLKKELHRIKHDDKRVADALHAATPARDDTTTAHEAAVAASKKASGATTTVTGGDGAKRAPDRRLGVKRVLWDHFKGGGKGTLKELCKLTGGTEVSVRTALSDIRNPKYAPEGKALKVERDDNDVYSLKG